MSQRTQIIAPPYSAWGPRREPWSDDPESWATSDPTKGRLRSLTRTPGSTGIPTQSGFHGGAGRRGRLRIVVPWTARISGERRGSEWSYVIHAELEVGSVGSGSGPFETVRLLGLAGADGSPDPAALLAAGSSRTFADRCDDAIGGRFLAVTPRFPLGPRIADVHEVVLWVCVRTTGRAFADQRGDFARVEVAFSGSVPLLTLQTVA